MPDTPNPFAPPSETSELTLVSPLENMQALASTERGLQITFYGLMIVILSYCAAIVAVFGFPPLAIAIGLILLIGLLLLIIGPLVCLMTPAETGAKGMIITAVVCQLLALTLSLGEGISGIMFDSFASQIINLSEALLALLSVIMFVLFMMRISTYLKRHDLRDKGKTILIAAGIITILAIASTVFQSFSSDLEIILLAMVGVGSLLVAIMFTSLIYRVYKAISIARAQSLPRTGAM
ncbi:hypothetical protein SH139x_000983 [Planctomycetaceae bacterium SH139]